MNRKLHSQFQLLLLSYNHQFLITKKIESSTPGGTSNGTIRRNPSLESEEMNSETNLPDVHTQVNTEQAHTIEMNGF